MNGARRWPSSWESSSTGHLILVGHALGFTGDIAANAEIAIQLGAILAVIVFEREKIGRLLSGTWQEQADLRRLAASSRGEGWSSLLRASLKAHPNLWFMAGMGVAFLPAGSNRTYLHRTRWRPRRFSAGSSSSWWKPDSVRAAP
jgi:hypothetical protein